IALGLAFDVGRWASTWREAAFAADAGAQAGASMLDEQAAYDGRVQLDLPPAEVVATEAALAARPRPGRRVLAEVRLTRLCVTVEQLFRPTLLRSVGIGETAVRASACAAPWRG
ncbi:MAG: hypothetical protein M3N51_09055, partial [Actinomycetota bacterium]|nr:hypothetical protein [Actinomycetota bacterium]